MLSYLFMLMQRWTVTAFNVFTKLVNSGTAILPKTTSRHFARSRAPLESEYVQPFRVSFDYEQFLFFVCYYTGEIVQNDLYITL